MNSTNTNNNVTTNTIVRKAYENTKANLPFILDGSFKKHGNTEGACGSHFIDGWNTQASVEHALFADLTGGNRWREVFRGGNTLIVETAITVGKAVLSATDLDKLAPDTPCRVDQLGAHPTLVSLGEPVPTDVVTAIIEIDGGADPDLKDFPSLKGEPVLATWFPGPSLPPSRPEGCKVGEILTAAEALKRGWRTVSLVEHDDWLSL